jgi:excisionase family DNA binding protein
MKAKPTDQRDDEPRELWTAEQVANFLGVPVATLYRWRHIGTGPHAYRVGRHLRYDPVKLRQWLDEKAA